MSKKNFDTGDLVVALESTGEMVHAGQLMIVSTYYTTRDAICSIVGTNVKVWVMGDNLALAKDYCPVLTVRERNERVFPAIKGILPEGGAVYVEIDKEADTYLDSYLEGEVVKGYFTSLREVNGVETKLAGFAHPIEEISDAVFHKASKIANLTVKVNLEEDIKKSLESIKEEVENLKRAYNIPVIGDYVVGELLSGGTKVVGKVIEEDFEDEDKARYMVEVISAVPFRAVYEYLTGLHLYVKDSTVKKLPPELNNINQLKTARQAVVIANKEAVEARELMEKAVEDLFVDAD